MSYLSDLNLEFLARLDAERKMLEEHNTLEKLRRELSLSILNDQLASPITKFVQDTQRSMVEAEKFARDVQEQHQRMVEDARRMLEGIGSIGKVGLDIDRIREWAGELSQPILPQEMYDPSHDVLSRLSHIEEILAEVDRCMLRPDPEPEDLAEEEEPPYGSDGVKREPGFKP